jgi:hypothetical protein
MYHLMDLLLLKAGDLIKVRNEVQRDILNHISGQLLITCEPIGRSYVTQGDCKICDLPPPSL